MTRVIIIGNAGGGKSTLSRRLAELTGLPYHSLDALMWAPGWVQHPDYGRRHQELISNERWIIDGFGTWETVLSRLDAADTVVHVDLPFWRHVWWATKRHIKVYLGDPPPAPEGCDYRGAFWHLLTIMWRLHRVWRTELLAALAERDRLKIYHLRSPGDFERFLAEAG
ncbi:MAG: flagellar protein FlaR [Rhodospirillaceae bacterium]|nr:flagellar protein FlaR [Rhodospirillaceae bacterium]